jgi:hypothetical protein
MFVLEVAWEGSSTVGASHPEQIDVAALGEKFAGQTHLAMVAHVRAVPLKR